MKKLNWQLTRPSGKSRNYALYWPMGMNGTPLGTTKVPIHDVNAERTHASLSIFGACWLNQIWKSWWLLIGHWFSTKTEHTMNKAVAQLETVFWELKFSGGKVELNVGILDNYRNKRISMMRHWSHKRTTENDYQGRSLLIWKVLGS